MFATTPWDLYLSDIYNTILYTFENIAECKPANLGASFFPVLSFSPLLNDQVAYNSLPLTQYLSSSYLPGNEAQCSCYS